LGHLPNKSAKIRHAERDSAAMDTLLGKISGPKRRTENHRWPETEVRTERVYIPNEEGRRKWVWVYCISPFCNHARAVPLAPWRIRWGVEDPSPLMRRYFRCGVCGRSGCVFHPPRESIKGVIETWDPEYFPAGRELHMAGPKEINESREEQRQRVLKAYMARYPNGDAIRTVDAMCNLYSMTKGPAAIRELAKAMRDLTGNLAPLPAIFPNRTAPVVRHASDGVRELTMMRWGFPPPNIPGSKPRNPYLTNVRNTDSRYWQTYLKRTDYRALVPVTSFAEPDNNQGPKSIWTWFAQDESRPLMFFAGIWREWEGDRGTKTVPELGKHLVFSFLTTDASPDVAPVHPDATPALLLDETAREIWMKAPMEEALLLQRPPPAGVLRVVAAGEKSDGAPA
jgi:putative SOS response-associated peptidase YedK